MENVYGILEQHERWREVARLSSLLERIVLVLLRVGGIFWRFFMVDNCGVLDLSGKKIVIKLGTKVVFDSELGKIRRDVTFRLARDVAELLRRGCEVVIVSSGAVGCGRELVRGKSGLGLKQARAAVGQIRLMGEYENVFSEFGIHVAQFLLNKDDLNSERLGNVKTAYENLSPRDDSGEPEVKIIPIVNENDVTTTDELTFGDNDGLAVEILEKFDFDVLLMLTNVGALVSGGDRVLESDGFDVSDYDDFGEDALGSGGLGSKLDVARRGVEMGKRVVIGKAGDDVVEILSGDVEGTWFCKSLKVSGGLD